MVSPCGALVVIRKKELVFPLVYTALSHKQVGEQIKDRFQSSLLHLSQVFVGGTHPVQLYMLTRSSFPPPSCIFSLSPYLIKRKHRSYPLSYRKEASFTVLQTRNWDIILDVSHLFIFHIQSTANICPIHDISFSNSWNSVVSSFYTLIMWQAPPVLSYPLLTPPEHPPQGNQRSFQTAQPSMPSNLSVGSTVNRDNYIQVSSSKSVQLHRWQSSALQPSLSSLSSLNCTSNSRELSLSFSRVSHTLDYWLHFLLSETTFMLPSSGWIPPKKKKKTSLKKKQNLIFLTTDTGLPLYDNKLSLVGYICT